MRYLLILAVVTAACAQYNSPIPAARPTVYTQGTQPKASASEYPTQGRLGGVDMGADYMVHSFGNGEQMYIAENFLIVEVAFFPPKGESVLVESSMFSLRVNGKKELLLPAAPTMAASVMRQPQWQSQRGVMGGIDMGGIGVGTGYPPPGSTGQGGPGQRLPAPPRAPDPDYPETSKKEVERAEDVLIRTALLDGPSKQPVSGFLYFPYKGKASGVKSVELLYHDAVLKVK